MAGLTAVKISEFSLVFTALGVSLGRGLAVVEPSDQEELEP